MSTLYNLSTVILASEDQGIVERIFGLDAQLLMDSVITACAVLFLFTLLSYLVFNPARELLKKRQEKVEGDIKAAEKDKLDAMEFKAEYDAKLQTAEKDAEAIISEGRKTANKRSEEIIGEAKAEAQRILLRTDKEIELERAKARDEVKNEMVDVAGAIAGRFISEKMDEAKQAQLVDEVLNEMGETTWQ